MDILYPEQHRGCMEYRRQGATRFRFSAFPNPHLPESLEIQRSTVLFLLDGEISVTCDNFSDKSLRANEMALCPARSCTYVRIIQSGHFISCAFTELQNLCNRLSFQNLHNFVPKNFRYDYTVLPVRPRIREYLTLLRHGLEDGLGCTHFHEMKGQELFLLLRAYYTNEELASFFFPLLGEDLDFKNWILMNYQLFLPIKDFAAMANMSVDTFKRTFKKEFGMPIHKWLTEQKAHLVCRDIMLGKHTLAEIADRYRFSSQAYLCTFCKTHLGKTPQKLRTQQPGHPFLAL